MAYRRAQSGGGTAAPVDTAPDPLSSFRAKYRAPAFVAPAPVEDETAGDRAAGVIASGYQGLTFGAGDKIIAGIQTALPSWLGGSKGFDFKQNLRDTRGVLDQYREAHPVESAATEFAGSLPSLLVGAPAALSGAANLSRAARIARLAGEGAVVGGVTGGLDAIRPDATIGDVGKRAAVSAGVGAVAAPILAPVVGAAVRGATRLGARVLPASIADRVAALAGGEPVTPRGQAREMVRGALESGGVDVAEAAKTSGLMPTKPVAPAPAPAAPAALPVSHTFPERPAIGADRKINGLDVGTKIDNQASIDATFSHERDFEQVPGIREVPIEGDVGPNAGPYQPRVRRLAEQIKENNRIDPLIWIDDPSGGYLLEGQHRIEALRSLGHKSFPAVVIRDLTKWMPEDLERAAIAKGESPDYLGIYGPPVPRPAASATPMAGRSANDEIRQLAETYRKTSGVAGDALPHPGAIDREKAGVMAHAYEALKNDPNDPEVKAAYAALVRETRAQAEALRAAGYEPEFVTDDPYKNSAEMMQDLAARKKIRVFKTSAENPHPLMSDEDNDLFRWVHDVFGHAQSGNQFGPLGEERAFRDHASMFSPEARRAMATETRGQNSWVNFGPNAELPVRERPFAEQKAAVMPPELVGDYNGIPRESPTTVMELGSRQVPSLVRAARNVPASRAAQTTDRFLAERAAGAGSRVQGALNEATGFQPTDTRLTVDQFVGKRANEARPLYEEAEKYGEIKNPDTIRQIEFLRKHPVFARAWSRGQALGKLERNEAETAFDLIPPSRMAELKAQGLDKFLPPEVARQSGPTVQDVNRFKKGLDAVIQSGYGTENALSKDESRVFRGKLNDVLGMVDEEVPAFKNARASFRGNSELVDAAEEGAKHFAPSVETGTLQRQLAEYSPGELAAYRHNALNKVAEQIRRASANPDLPEAGRAANVLQRIMGTDDAGQRLRMLFPDEASYEHFLRQVEDEALYPKTDKFLRGQSSTAGQLAEAKMSPKDWADVPLSVFSKGARFRLLKRALADKGDAGMAPAIADEVGDIATTTGYRMRGVLRDMTEQKSTREAGRRRLLSLSNAAVAGSAAAHTAPRARDR